MAAERMSQPKMSQLSPRACAGSPAAWRIKGLHLALQSKGPGGVGKGNEGST